jgi:P27 family predicted phage terminase small subunit
MGERGPKPRPNNVHHLLGNPSKKPLNQLLDSVSPDVEIPGCPAHLMPEARKEWKRIAPELEKLRLIAKIDRAALALYCQAWARWLWAEKMLRRAQDAAAVKMAEAEAKGEVYSGPDGYVVATPNGHLGYSPHWVIANKAMEQIDKFLASFGMSPSSRSRVTPSAQMDMFPKPDGDDKPDQQPTATRFFTGAGGPNGSSH